MVFPGRSQEAEAVRKAIWNLPNGHVVFFWEQQKYNPNWLFKQIMIMLY